jgi:toxin ParE1/3/4
MTLRIDPGAVRDADEAATYYDALSGGLGERFLDAVDEAVAAIQVDSLTGSPYEPLNDSAVRRRKVRRFPYVVIYEIDDTAVVVLAIAHERRRPDYWSDRRSREPP